MAYALNGDAGNGGSLGGRITIGAYCNDVAATSFEGVADTGFEGSGGFGPPKLAFAARRNACAMFQYKQAGSPAPLPAPAASASQVNPLLVILLILLLVGVLS